ncbi:hypothetical protein EAF04_008487 [Stromatinia cepivora]|nr:hypothetical protein EAF04_008487 [Stromatinia cepivora]
MSMATVLVHQSKTRRKACEGCVKAKRRCDLLLPTCSRCKIKSFDCIYVDDASRKKSKRSSQGRTSIPGPVKSTAVAQFSTNPHKVCLDVQPHDDTNIPVLDYQSQQLGQDLTPWNSTTITSFPPDILLPSTNSITSLDPHIQSIPIDTFPSPYSSLQYPLRTTLSSTQVTYLVTQVKSFVSAFALHSQNSFIHRLTFRNPNLPLPTSYTDALSICALHTLNCPQTFSILDSKLSCLISSSKKDYWGTDDWLSGVQVFILYQIIRLWSSNERQKLNAERHIPLLMQWTNQLQIEYIGLLAQGIELGLPINNGEKGEIQDYHKRWILMESIRRTVMISVVLQCLYGGCKDGYIGGLLPILFGLPVSPGAGRVWEALGKRIYDVQGEWEDQSDIHVEFGEVYTYEYWSEGWKLGIVEGGETEQEIYERMLLVACHKTGACERWGREIEVENGGMGMTVGGFAMGVQF